MNENSSKGQIPTRGFILDKLLGIISISTMAAIWLYFLLAPPLHHTHALKPSQGFLYSIYYFLGIILIIYFITFVIKIVYSFRKDKLNVRFGTPLVFDLIVILAGALTLTFI